MYFSQISLNLLCFLNWIHRVGQLLVLFSQNTAADLEFAICGTVANHSVICIYHTRMIQRNQLGLVFKVLNSFSKERLQMSRSAEGALTKTGPKLLSSCRLNSKCG